MSNILNGQTKDSILVDGDLILTGQVCGDVTVVDGANFECRGQITGNLLVKGGRVSVPGMVCGTILVEGGKVDIKGAAGRIVDPQQIATVSPAAMIMGVKG